MVDRPRPRHGLSRSLYLERQAKKKALVQTRADLLKVLVQTEADMLKHLDLDPTRVALENLKQARLEYLGGP